MKNYIFILATLGLMSCSESTEKDEVIKRPVPTVEVFELKAQEVARVIEVPGSAIPSEEVMLFSEVNGRVNRILFKEGQSVRKGQALIKIDTDILQAQKKQLTVDLKLAEKDEARKKGLLEGKAISMEEYEQSSSALASVKASISLINTQIKKATLYAPFSGTIGLRQISEGAVVSTTTPIAKLIQTNPVKIEFSISEMYAPYIKSGQQVSFVRENDSTNYIAEVYAFEPSIDEGTRMLKTRAAMKKSGDVFPGSYINIKIDLGVESNAFMVPAESITPILKGQKVFVVRKGKVEEVVVSTGIRTSDKVQINGDVRAGDKVLVSGLLAVRAGMPVNIKK